MGIENEKTHSNVFSGDKVGSEKILFRPFSKKPVPKQCLFDAAPCEVDATVWFNRKI